MIRALVDKIKFTAISHPLVNMASVGDITLYDNKSTIMYPYVNVDVISDFVSNFIKTYTIRVYVCDRNEPYIAYNKAELIITDMMQTLDVNSYTVNFFNLDFQDVVNGVYADIAFQIPMGCAPEAIFDYRLFTETFIILENGDFLTQENGVYITE